MDLINMEETLVLTLVEVVVVVLTTTTIMEVEMEDLV